MILTITLNPAVDRTVSVSGFAIDKVNRVKDVRRDIGGKGLNVTKTVVALGGQSKALLVLGGANGKFIEERANSEKLQVEIFNIEGETRENIKIVDPELKTFTDINEPGPVLAPEQVNLLLETIADLLAEGDWVVISGSAPLGITDDFYNRLFEKTKQKGIKAIADVSGNQLKQILTLKPNMIKPNIHELSELFNQEMCTLEEAIKYAQQLVASGIETVVVSLGEEGLLWVDDQDILLANALKVDVKSTVGAGDAIVAGLTLGQSRKLAKADIMKMAVASATCVITEEGSKTGDMSQFDLYTSKIAVQKLNV